MGSRAGTELPTSPLFRLLPFSTPTPPFPSLPDNNNKEIGSAVCFSFQFGKAKNSILFSRKKFKV